MTITNKIKTVEINLPKLYQEFQEENIHCLGLWDWEQERDAFGCYCYLEARKELIEEEIEFLNNLRNDFSK